MLLEARAAGAPGPFLPSPACMERLKRHLLRRLPLLLGGGPPPGAFGRHPVLLLGDLAPATVEEALRLEGLRALLAAAGFRPAGRGRPWGRPWGHPVASALWIGGPPPSARDLARMAPGATLLLWPPYGSGEPLRPTGHGGAWLPPLRVVAPELPEPAHALWGLLDHHPWGEGVLELRGDDPARAWAGLLPPTRIRPMPLAARLHRRAGDLARRRLLEAARRAIARHAMVAADTVGASLFAALLGRPTLWTVPGAAAAYWARWAEAPGQRPAGAGLDRMGADDPTPCGATAENAAKAA